jgi:hypothetical protein
MEPSPKNDFDKHNDKLIEDFNISEIPDKVDLYKNLFNNLFVKTRLTKDKLDSYHLKLHKANSAVQLSVIYFSAASSFIQALSSSSYSIIFKNNDNILNITDENIPEIGAVDQDTYSSFVPTIILCISTYSSLVIAGARHLKIEEKENNVSNLRNRFTELVSRIKHNLDLLRPWENENYYLIDPKKEKVHDWFSLIKKIEKEYSHIIDIRQDLYVTYNQIITKKVNDRYYNKDKKEELEAKIQRNNNNNTCASRP